MIGRIVLFQFLVAIACSTVIQAQSTKPADTEARQERNLPSFDFSHRSVRRNMPVPKSIRAAYKAGTRDISGRPGPNYWQLQTDYDIDVRLDVKAHTLHGRETILIHNNSPDDLDSIVLRLDHNIFREGAVRGRTMTSATDGMVISRMAIAGEEIELTTNEPTRQRGRGRRAENDGSRKSRAFGLNRTVATISLAKPIPSHSKAELEIDWHTELPSGLTNRGNRMNMRWGDTLFQPTQWFPRVAKYDDLSGWANSVYLGNAEFYNNFGKFDVRIDVPAGWIVSGTGILQNPKEVLTETAQKRLATVLDSDEEITIVGEDESGPGKSTVDGDRLVWHFAAEMVNDFAWATAENYVWKATRATIPGKGPIPIHMVFVPERADRFERAGKISRHALEFYSKLWIAYPFPQLTMQDGPSAGMEYPMVINSNQGAADHEVGHQWWPMMVGTNETWYGWMDEGLNTYMNALSSADSRGRPANLDGRGQRYGRVSGRNNEPTMMWPSNFAGPMYGYQAYSKAPCMLSMLGGIVGDDEVQRAMREYTEAWAFKHPSPWDFAFSMSNSLDRDLGWFWNYWLFETESVDALIENVSTDNGTTIVTVRQDGEMPSPVVLKVEFAKEGPEPADMPNAEFLEDGSAYVVWPVDVWFDGSRTFEAKLEFGDRKIEKITFDPKRRFPDSDPQDNVWKSTEE